MQTLQFEERLYPAAGMYLAYSLLSPMVLLAAAPFGWALAIALGALTLLAALVLASVLSPMVLVDDVRLVAGKMAIPLSAIGSVEEIGPQNLRQELGPKLDARAQLLIRGDLKTAVRVSISDPQDPTPYLIISTRRPNELVSALRANRT
ncbi:MAG: hypothetical protein RL174_276 [Actinomycetota bacterium]